MTRPLRFRGGASGDDTGPLFRCSAGARWLPRVLAAASLASGLLAAQRLDLARELPFARGVQVVVMGAGALLAVWLLRAGAESRLALTIGARRLLFAYGARTVGLEYEQIERLDYEAPFGMSRQLFPAVVLRDRDGRDWRVPVVLTEGGRALHELLERAGRDDLVEWAATLRLGARMGRGAIVVATGYALAAALLLAAAYFYLR